MKVKTRLKKMFVRERCNICGVYKPYYNSQGLGGNGLTWQAPTDWPTHLRMCQRRLSRQNFRAVHQDEEPQRRLV